MRSSLLYFICMILCSFSNAQNMDPLDYVDPFIGTGGHGHTYPGATFPFGMVQLSPDTRLTGWDGCSGYHYSDSVIYGFSHTHLSGTGVSDYGDILFMPFLGEDRFSNGSDGKGGYSSPFKKSSEKACPGFYQVFLEDYGIDVQLTAGKRTGIQKYSFPPDSRPKVILDLKHRDELLNYHLEIVSPTELKGYRYSSAWAQNQKCHFYSKLSSPISGHRYNTDSTKLILYFAQRESEISIHTGLSMVDMKGAYKNLISENHTFDELMSRTQKSWRKELNKIQVTTFDKARLTIFYTALYHTMVVPNICSDMDGRYRGMDDRIYAAKDHEQYTVFSLWDTYRATHPLYTIIDQKRTRDYIKTFLNQYSEGGFLPMWELSNNYTGCMIGYHAVPVISDAFMKGIEGFDSALALEAMQVSATAKRLGIPSYMEHGYIPAEDEPESVSKTLEYAYDDWCIGRMAGKLKREDLAEKYFQRSRAYMNVFDSETKFMRARMDNRWFSPFDPSEVNYHYTEANAWQYSYYVPHDIFNWTKALGGVDQLEGFLDELFESSYQTTGRDQADITGLIGQYAHGNEPSHHIAYLYNWTNAPYKAQSMTQRIMREMYSTNPDGYSGNEDCGQMSAWLVLSAMGFYPVAPGSNEYVFGSPWLDTVRINLENGSEFLITTDGLDQGYEYIQEVSFNGIKYPYTYLHHNDLMQGGHIHFILSKEPTAFGVGEEWHPTSRLNSEEVVAVPYVSKGDRAFYKNTQVELGCLTPESMIWYQWNDEKPKRYNGSFEIYDTGVLEVWAEKKGFVTSKKGRSHFAKRTEDIDITLFSEYGNHYSAGGDQALVDGITGGGDYRTGHWQGYEGQDLEAVVDLKKRKKIKNIGIRFLQDENSWIFMPKKVEFWVSKCGKKYQPVGKISTSIKPEDKGSLIEEFAIEVEGKIRYIKIKAYSLKYCPETHKGAGGKCWIFADEILIN